MLTRRTSAPIHPHFARSSKVQTALILCATLAFGACGAPPGEGEGEGQDDDFGSSSQAIENGELLPSSLNGGVVQLTIPTADGTANGFCSGQVVSRNTIATAAHCFYKTGWYDSGWDSEIAVRIIAQHQNPSGTKELLSSSKYIYASVFVQEAYVTYADADSTRKIGYDIALVRAPSTFSNTDASDVAALSRLIPDQPERLYAYGYGYSEDGVWDKKLRRGTFESITWYDSSTSERYRSLLSNYDDDDPHVCGGDSGGPWKIPALDSSSFSGVQFGVTATGSGGGECKENYATAALTSYNDFWIQDVIEDGGASCVREDHVVSPRSGSMSVMTVNALRCW